MGGGGLMQLNGGIAVNYGQKLITKKAGELLGECDIFAYQVKGLGNN